LLVRSPHQWLPALHGIITACLETLSYRRRSAANGDHHGCRNIHSCLSSAVVCGGPRSPPCGSLLLLSLLFPPAATVCPPRGPSRDRVEEPAFVRIVFFSSFPPPSFSTMADRQTQTPNMTVVGTHACSEIFVTCDPSLLPVPLRAFHITSPPGSGQTVISSTTSHDPPSFPRLFQNLPFPSPSTFDGA
jgi:hypothetical protein